MPGFDMPIGKLVIDGPKPFRVEYPFGMPGDSFRNFAREGKATCVAYHRGVDSRALAAVERGNKLRYGPGDDRFEALKAGMLEHGYLGGDGQRIIVHVDHERAWIAEGNHRLEAALKTGISDVEVEIRYLNRADEDHLLIAFDPHDPSIRVYAD